MSARKQKPLPVEAIEPVAALPEPGNVARTIAELFADLTAEVPQAKWDSLPADLSETWDKHRTGR